MNYVELAVPFFILAMGLEYLYGLVRGKQTYRLNDTVNSLSLGVLSRLVDVLKLGFSAIVFGALVSWLGIPQWGMESFWQWIVAFVAYDFFYYWKHRFGHQSRFFWASHVAHHQSEEFNLSTALRQTGTDYFGFVFYFPLYLAGIPPYVIVTVGSLNLIYQFWVHTEHVGRLGPIEWVFVTPSNHRVHHARNEIYLDKNYGGVFILWDRLFGTYQDELTQESCVFGTVKPLASWNPIWANFHIWLEMLQISFKTKHWQDKLSVWFKRPGWFPSDMEQQYQPDLSAPKFNPQTSKWIKIYAFTNFWIITGLSLWLLEKFNDMPQLIVIALFIWMSSSLFVFGAALENKTVWIKLEWCRIVATVLLALGCTFLWQAYSSDWGVVLFTYSVFNTIAAIFIQLTNSKAKNNLAYT